MSDTLEIAAPVKTAPVNRTDPALKPVGGAKPSGRIEAVDGLRALACMMVVAYHAWKNSGEPALTVPGLQSTPLSAWGLGRVIAAFPSGVDMFMVLSGFCLFWPTARRPESLATWSWRDYARRRVKRIVPPYYASIVFATLLPNLLVLFYLALRQPAKWQVLPGVWDYVTHLLFIHTWFPATWDGIQGVYWSLGLEAQFYLVFPLVLMAFKRWGIKVTWVMIALSIIFRTIMGKVTADSPWPVGFLVTITFLGRWMEFAGGMMAAWAVARQQRRREVSSRQGTTFLLLALGAYFIAVTMSDNEPLPIPTRELLYAFSFGMALFSLCATRTPVRRFFEWKPITALGFMSFSVFLIHQNLIFYISQGLEKVAHLHGGMLFAVLITAGVAVVLAVSYAFFRLVEKPLLAPAKRPVTLDVVARIPAEAGVS